MNAVQPIGNIIKTEVLSANHDAIVFADTTLNLVPRKYYQLQFDDGKKFHFTFDNFDVLEGKLVLDYVVWLFVKPEINQGNALLQEVDVPRKEKGQIKTAFIADNLGCCIMNGKKIRYEWNKINRDLNFMGEEKDVFGYGYYGGNDITTSEFLKISNDVKDKDLVVLWIGRSDGNKSAKETSDNIQSLIKDLISQNPQSKIALIYPAPSPVNEFDDRIYKIVQELNKLPVPKTVTKIDLYSFIKNQPNWKDKWFFQEYGLTDEAYKAIIKYVNNEIFR